jgi:tetratricopeptide (TPR) repeat protein
VQEAEQLRDQLTALGDMEGAQRAELAAAWGLFVAGKAGECFARAQAVLDSLPSRDGPIAAHAMQERGPAAVFGPLPADEVLRLLGEGIEDGFEWPGGELGAGRMLAVLGRIPEARAMVARGRERTSELGDRLLISTVDAHDGFIALILGDADEAIRAYERSYETKVATGDRGFASTAAAELAEAYLEANDLPRAWDYAVIARETSATDDIASQAGGRTIQARVLSARGDHAAAETLARQAVAIMEETDYLLHHGDSLVHLAHVLHAAGNGDAAVAAAREAIEVYERKRATFFVERTRGLIEEWGNQAV